MAVYVGKACAQPRSLDEGEEPRALPNYRSAAALATLAVAGALGLNDPSLFGGPRKTLNDLTPAQRTELAKLIYTYTHADHSKVVMEHMSAPPDVHHAPYAHFFTFHHEYLQGLEDYLTSIGKTEYVPLPKWIPGDVPPEFQKLIPKGAKAPIDFSAFADSKLPAFTEDVTSGATDKTDPTRILADQLVPVHNEVHNTIGGTMAKMSSPAAPIFWPWHAFLDDIWTEWQKAHPTPPATATATARDGVALDDGPNPNPMPLTDPILARDMGTTVRQAIAASKARSRGVAGALDLATERADPVRDEER
jgi:hypothetical protein